jgi:hypothetical protein
MEKRGCLIVRIVPDVAFAVVAPLGDDATSNPEQQAGLS